MAPRIVVLGSANLDIVVPVPHHPTRGETILGGDHARIPGGKGANQAVAASRLGGDVQFVGRVGDDAAGSELRHSLENAGVNTDALHVTAGVPSGIALITIDAEGDNAIVVSPGANFSLSPADVERHAPLADSPVVQLQLEVPLETNLAAAQRAEGVVILDPAPAPPEGLPNELLGAVDIVIPNEIELAMLARRPVDPDDLDDLTDAARGLRSKDVIVTLGSRGAVVVSTEVTHVKAPTISAIDTTAAGDAFRSAIAVGVANGLDLVSSTRQAVRVGAATALRFGAQPSLPTRAEVEQLLT